TRSLSRRDPHPCVSNCRCVGLADRSGAHVLATSVGGLDPDEERCLLAMCGAGLVDAGAGDSGDTRVPAHRLGDLRTLRVRQVVTGALMPSTASITASPPMTITGSARRSRSGVTGCGTAEAIPAPTSARASADRALMALPGWVPAERTSTAPAA